MVVNFRSCLALGFLIFGARQALAAVAAAEDLAGCRLPNGTAFLPAPDAPQASRGMLYKFSTGQFSAIPSAGGRVLSSEEALAAIRQASSADLTYLPAKNNNGGSLWAFSGSISEVPGMLYLSDATGKKLDEPFPVPATSKNAAGESTNLREGAVYLVKTIDNHYALLRILDKSASGVVIQFVYQANGLAFDIPVNAPIPYQPNTPVAPVAPIATTAPIAVPAPADPGPRGPAISVASDPVVRIARPTQEASSSADALALPPLVDNRIPTTLPAVPKPVLGPGDIVEPGRIILVAPSGAGASSSNPGIVPSLDSFNRQRTQMLQHDLAVLSTPARSEPDVERKNQAITELIYLHADEPEAADALVNDISFVTNKTAVREFSRDAWHPCYAALKHLGASASAACLRGLHKLDLDSMADGTDAAAYKADLMARVIRSVEGDDVAEFIFRREAGKESDPKRRALFESLVAK